MVPGSTSTAVGPVARSTMKMQGGRPPFRWLANGKPAGRGGAAAGLFWQPDGQGISTLTVIDAAGRAASVTVSVE